MLGGIHKSSSRRRPESFDRFIPNRRSLNLDYAHFQIMNCSYDGNDVFEGIPAKSNPYQKKLNCLSNTTNVGRILSFSPKTKNSDLCKATSYMKQRLIPSSPEKILDLPHLRDDYYIHVLDWSSLNVIAVALDRIVYSWNVSSHRITTVRDLESDSYCTCLKWNPNGRLLAIGTSQGVIEIWDTEIMKCVRTFILNHSIEVLTWQNENVFSSGLEGGSLFHHSLKSSLDWSSSSINFIQSQEICSLAYSPDRKYLAIGSNEFISILSTNQNNCVSEWRAHTSAIRGLVYLPCKSNILVSGGGCGDGHIKFWNLNTFQMKSHVKTNSQVCSLLWADKFGELVSSHGIEHNDVILWKYPDMQEVGRLSGYTSRVLHMCLSPDGSKLATASSDETLRIWPCFIPDVNKNKSRSKYYSTVLPSSPLSFSIR